MSAWPGVFTLGGGGDGPLGIENRILTVASEIFSCSMYLDITRAPAGAAWPAANDPVALRFRIAEPMTVNQLGWMNGSAAATDSIDVGVYDDAFARLVSGGGTARSGANVWQWVNVTDTLLPAGDYYLAASANGTAANQQLWVSLPALAVAHALIGTRESTTDSYPLPDPLTNMVTASAFTRIPYLAVATRAPF